MPIRAEGDSLELHARVVASHRDECFTRFYVPEFSQEVPARSYHEAVVWGECQFTDSPFMSLGSPHCLAGPRVPKLDRAIGLANGYPVTIERLAEWSLGLRERNFALAPVSAIVNQQPDR